MCRTRRSRCICTNPGDDLFTPYERRRGLPIGNLTSQLFANVYLDRFDHFVTEVLRAPYLRYVDDFALFDDDPGRLAAWRDRAETLRWTGIPARSTARSSGTPTLPATSCTRASGPMRAASTSAANRRAKSYSGSTLVTNGEKDIHRYRLSTTSCVSPSPPRRWRRGNAGSAASHSSSASDSTNRTRSTCREMDCFW